MSWGDALGGILGIPSSDNMNRHYEAMRQQIERQASNQFGPMTHPSWANTHGFPGAMQNNPVQKKEKTMDITPDHTGSVRKIDDHLLIKFGCTTKIVHNPKEAGKTFAAILKEVYPDMK